MKVSRAQTVILLLIALCPSACNAPKAKPHDEALKVTVTTVQSKAVTLTQPYVCQIRAHHFIKVRTPQTGYLEAIAIKEGQAVKNGDLLFQLKPTVEKEKRDPAKAHELVSIKAPFDGMVDRLRHQQGSLVEQGETLTTLADNSLMWVYFYIPEARYLEYKSANLDQHQDDLKIELVLANGDKFDQPGKLGAIGADFDSATGNLTFRADFSNPDGLLRHGQTGTVLISQVQNDAIVVPQAATLEFGQSRYVYVVDKDDVVHQREIVIENATEDLFVIKAGVEVDDTIVLDGIRELRDGDKVQYEDLESKQVAAG